MLENPARLQSAEYQAYAVLIMCRALYTLEKGTLASKPVSARWARVTLGKRWSDLIGWALTQQTAAQSDHLDETLDLIRCTLEQSQKRADPGGIPG